MKKSVKDLALSGLLIAFVETVAVTTFSGCGGYSPWSSPSITRVMIVLKSFHAAAEPADRRTWTSQPIQTDAEYFGVLPTNHASK